MPRSSVSVSGFKCSVDAPRTLRGMPICFGEVESIEQEDGSKLACMVGTDHEAPEVYVIVKRDPQTKKPTTALVCLGFSGPALARSIFFACHKPDEYDRLATWQADRYLEAMTAPASDEWDEMEGDGEEED